MLEITIPAIEQIELFDETTNTFFMSGSDLPAVTIQLEHSLVSLSKWESLWEKPFLDDVRKTQEETISYVQTMCLTPDVPSEVFDRLSPENMQQISEYINQKMTATWFSEPQNKLTPTKKEVITSEIIYYWMFALTIPWEFERWHVNRLFTLIKVTNEKNTPKDSKNTPKLGRAAIAANRRALAEQRRREYNTTG